MIFKELPQLEDLCYKITHSPLLRNVNNDNSEVVKEVATRLRVPLADAGEKCRGTALDLTKDAIQIIRELPNCTKVTPNGVLFETQGLLGEVWSGDAYGVGQLAGIKKLINDLEEQCEIMYNTKLFIKRVCG